MATLSKHGNHKQIDYLTHKIALCEDGNILKNRGFGWKLHAKLKPGINYLEAYENRLRKIERTSETLPVFTAYKRELMKWKLSDRVKILMAFQLLGDDLDGIWSELNDLDRVDIDLDEIREIFHLRNAAMKEKQAMERGEA